MNTEQPSSNHIKYAVAASFLIIFLLLIYIIGNQYGLPAIAQIPTGSSTNLAAIFLTGLLTGGLTCLAVQGGLLAATLSQRAQQRLENNLEESGNAFPILSFLTAKIIAYTALGFLLGALGSVVQLSLTGKLIMQFAVAVFMLGTALNLLNVHPIFRYFIIQPPKFLTRMVRKKSKSSDLFAPATLGAFTVFIPCGTTQAMMALAIASGSSVLGAAIMATFTLGTSPVFFTLGYFATRFGDKMQSKFTKIAALFLIGLSLYTLGNSLALAGFQLPGKNSDVLAQADKTANNNATLYITEKGYEPEVLTVNAGEKVTLNLINTDGWGCQQAFVIPSLGYEKVLSPGKSDVFTFTAPKEKGTIQFMCSMGMYRGLIQVI